MSLDDALKIMRTLPPQNWQSYLNACIWYCKGARTEEVAFIVAQGSTEWRPVIRRTVPFCGCQKSRLHIPSTTRPFLPADHTYELQPGIRHFIAPRGASSAAAYALLWRVSDESLIVNFVDLSCTKNQAQRPVPQQLPPRGIYLLEVLVGQHIPLGHIDFTDPRKVTFTPDAATSFFQSAHRPAQYCSCPQWPA